MHSYNTNCGESRQTTWVKEKPPTTPHNLNGRITHQTDEKKFYEQTGETRLAHTYNETKHTTYKSKENKRRSKFKIDDYTNRHKTFRKHENHMLHTCCGEHRQTTLAKGNPPTTSHNNTDASHTRLTTI